MSYEENDSFRQPTTIDAPVWRYMDLAKFLSLVESRTLYFPSITTLAKVDPYEGFSGPQAGLLFEGSFEDLPPQYKIGPRAITSPEAHADWLESNRRIRALLESVRRYCFASSWHMQDGESAAMWSLYSKSHEGIAIRTTYRRLREAFDMCPQAPIFIGPVTYIDYAPGTMLWENVMSASMHKRKSFEHEREVRAMIAALPDKAWPNQSPFTGDELAGKTGVAVPINLERLIETVYVSPYASGWIAPLIERLLVKFELKVPVIPSDLYRPIS